MLGDKNRLILVKTEQHSIGGRVQTSLTKKLLFAARAWYTAWLGVAGRLCYVAVLPFFSYFSRAETDLNRCHIGSNRTIQRTQFCQI